VSARAAPAPFDRIAIEILARTGLRVGEFLDLTVDAVVQIGSGYWLRVPLGKLHNDRYVPLHPQLKQLIDEWVAARPSGLAGKWLWMQNGRRITRARVSAALNRATDTAGLDHVTPHQLRHTLATQAINRGMSLEALAALLGHKNLSMTLVYARIADRTVADEYFRVSQQVEALYDQPAELPADLEGTEMRKLRGEMHRRMLATATALVPSSWTATSNPSASPAPSSSRPSPSGRPSPLSVTTQRPKDRPAARKSSTASSDVSTTQHENAHLELLPDLEVVMPQGAGPVKQTRAQPETLRSGARLAVRGGPGSPVRCSVSSCLHRFVLSRSLRQYGARCHVLYVGLEAKLQRRTAQKHGVFAHRLDDRETRRISVHQGVAHAPTPRLEHLALGRISIRQCGICGVIADASEHALNPRPFRLDGTERRQVVRSVRDEEDPGSLRIAGVPLVSQLVKQLLSPSATEQAHMHGALNVGKPPRMWPPLAEQVESRVRIQRGVCSDVLDHSIREWDHASDVRFGWFAEGHVAAEWMVRVVCTSIAAVRNRGNSSRASASAICGPYSSIASAVIPAP